MPTLITLFLPGVGHMMNGRILQGLVWMAVVAVGYLMMIVPGVVLHLICLVDCSRDSGRKADARMQRQAELMATAMRNKK